MVSARGEGVYLYQLNLYPLQHRSMDTCIFFDLVIPIITHFPLSIGGFDP